MWSLRLLGLVTVAGLTVAQNTTSADAHCIQGQFTWVRCLRSASREAFIVPMADVQFAKSGSLRCGPKPWTSV